MLGEPQKRMAIEHDFPGSRSIQSAEAVEKGRLARAIGADNSTDMTTLDLKRHVIKSDDAAKTDQEALNRKQRVHIASCSSRVPKRTFYSARSNQTSKRHPAAAIKTRKLKLLEHPVIVLRCGYLNARKKHRHLDPGQSGCLLQYVFAGQLVTTALQDECGKLSNGVAFRQ